MLVATRSSRVSARLCCSLPDSSDVRFEHVKAHEGNPFNELADGLAKRSVGGVVAPLPLDVSRLLVCCDSVTWEWTHVVLTHRCVTGLSFSLRLVRALSLAVLLGVASDVETVHCSTDVVACVHLGSFNVCTLGDVVVAASSLWGGQR